MTSHPPEGPEAPRASTASRWQGRLKRWPVKLAAAVGAAFLAWFVGFVGPKVFNSAATKVTGPKPPLSVVVVRDIARFTSPADASYGVPLFVLPGKIDGLGAPPDPNPSEVDRTRQDERWSWAHAHGAVDAVDSLVRLKISATSSTPVIVDDLRVVVTKRDTPLRGWFLTYTGLGSSQGVRYFQVGLDRPTPSVTYVGGHDPLPLRVSDTDVELVDLLAGASRCDCSWDVKLDWVSADKQGTTTIDDHGTPFRTTGEARGTPQTFWYHGRWTLLGTRGVPAGPARD